jgi:adenylosuccinate synthase
MPFDLVNYDAEPVYEELDGWHDSLDQVQDVNALPAALHNYIEYIEKATGLPVTIVSVGPDRSQTLLRHELVR